MLKISRQEKRELDHATLHLLTEGRPAATAGPRPAPGAAKAATSGDSAVADAGRRRAPQRGAQTDHQYAAEHHRTAEQQARAGTVAVEDNPECDREQRSE